MTSKRNSQRKYNYTILPHTLYIVNLYRNFKRPTQFFYPRKRRGVLQ